MRIGWLLVVMAVSGAGLLAVSAATEQAWPLFAIWAAYALALPLASRGDPPDAPREASPPDAP